MGDLGEFTVANIAMEEDKREEKKGTVDRTKLEADIKAHEALAKEVRYIFIKGMAGIQQILPLSLAEASVALVNPGADIDPEWACRASLQRRWRGCWVWRSSSAWQKTSQAPRWPAQPF